MTKYLIFNSLAEAEAAEQEIAKRLGLPRMGRNAATGQLDPNATWTTNWATPIPATNGRWFFPSPDNQGVDFDPSWLPPMPGSLN